MRTWSLLGGAGSLALAAWLLHVGTDDLVRVSAYQSEVEGFEVKGVDHEVESVRKHAAVFLGFGVLCLAAGIVLLLAARTRPTPHGPSPDEPPPPVP